MKFKALLLCLLFMACAKKKESSTSLIGHLPKNPIVILKVNSLSNLQNELTNNTFTANLITTTTGKRFTDRLAVLKGIDSIGEVAIAFYENPDTEIDFLLTTQGQSNLFRTENFENIKKETVSYNTYTLEKVTIEEDAYYVFEENGLRYASNQLNLIKSIAEDTAIYENSDELNTLYQTTDNSKSASILFNFQNSDSLNNSSIIAKNNSVSAISKWVSLDIVNENNNLFLNGVATANDSVFKFSKLFEGTIPQTERIANAVPGTAEGLLVYGYGDYSQFSKNKETYLQQSQDRDTILNTTEELGVFTLGSEKVVALNSYGLSGLLAYMEPHITKTSTFEGYEIHALNDTSFVTDRLSPLVTSFESNFYFISDNIIFFAETASALERVISNYKIGNTFAKTRAYIFAKEKLPTESSIFLVTKANSLESFLNNTLTIELNQDIINSAENMVFAAQLTADQSVYHTQVIIAKPKEKSSTSGVSQLVSIQLDTDLAIDPIFVKNHRNNSYEVVVQDIDNNLYLISTDGKILWKKPLENKIRGKIHQVDVFKNGKLQLAFCTSNQFLILDRNGELVEPFNKKFEGGNLNPLAVFDYDKDRNYRFVVTQGTKVFMYNSKGNIVKGFTYTDTNSPIVKAPKHFSIGKKDYLVFALENNQLQIRHRSGGQRIKVNRKIDFSNNPIFLYKNKFSVTDKKGVLHQVDTKGGLAATNFNLSKNHGMFATSKTLALMDENVLSIKGKKVELDLGVYSAPQIFYIYDKIYVSVTDIQNQQIYLFDSQAQPISGFPVNGSSAIDLIDVDGDRKLELVTKDQENSILLYQLN
ncbi:ribonuclease HII [Croceivirga lutea]|uniref:ribonuclease HII n=1 Tax=Croceivirga lutea TaxID=1775167 RepID=UPI00163A65EB|nr:ribonuclease HII [Croceivirga lutea]